jgi:RimJ/RimL family protein N-acetyltransferase
MEIRKSQMTDLEDIMSIYDNARIFMANHGNAGQWGTTFPPQALIEKDIHQQKSYVCVEEGKPVGVFYFAKEEDPTYRIIENGTWLNDRPYAVVHRIASAKDTKGVATFCITWAYAQKNNLRIDTHENNIPMQGLLKKLGFTPCGRIYVEDGSPRIAFQKA